MADTLLVFATATTDFATAIGAIGVLLAGVWGLFKIILNQAANDRNADRNERKEFIKALNNVAETNKEIAAATNKAATEAEKRNGHLAEIQIEARDTIINAVQNVHTQHVVEQTVQQSNVKDETVEHETVNKKE